MGSSSFDKSINQVYDEFFFFFYCLSSSSSFSFSSSSPPSIDNRYSLLLLLPRERESWKGREGKEVREEREREIRQVQTLICCSGYRMTAARRLSSSHSSVLAVSTPLIYYALFLLLPFGAPPLLFRFHTLPLPLLILNLGKFSPLISFVEPCRSTFYSGFWGMPLFNA